METKQIQLSQGQVALINMSDYDLVAPHRWHAVRTHAGFYAARRCGSKTIYMHRLLMDVVDQPRSVFVDHIDFNGLNNTRANLQLCSPEENVRKRRSRRFFDGSKGVWLVRPGSWAARIVYEGKGYYLGAYTSEREAAIAYDAAATVLFGRFAARNFQ